MSEAARAARAQRDAGAAPDTRSRPDAPGRPDERSRPDPHGPADGHSRSGHSRSDGHARSDTRARIQSVALELFAEQGYDKTSLREIAERLDVTKAALYYHFKSKEDIVASLVEDYFGQIDDLVAWGRTRPRTPAARAEVLNRYFNIVADGSEVFRMLQHNQASVNSLGAAKHRSELFRERMDSLVSLLTEPDAPLAEQIRAAVALVSVSFGCMFFGDRAKDPDELRTAVLDIAFGLTGARE